MTSAMPECYVCKHSWVEYDTLCGETVCSEECKVQHQAWCSWCAHVYFNQLNDPRVESIAELYDKPKGGSK